MQYIKDCFLTEEAYVITAVCPWCRTLMFSSITGFNFDHYSEDDIWPKRIHQVFSVALHAFFVVLDCVLVLDPVSMI